MAVETENVELAPKPGEEIPFFHHLLFEVGSETANDWSGKLTPEFNMEVSYFTYFFVDSFATVDLEVARRWVENIMQFSETRLFHQIVTEKDGHDILTLYFGVNKRVLALGFSESDTGSDIGIKVKFNYKDENMQQEFKTEVPLENIYYNNSISCLFIDLENGNSLGLIKERGTIAVQTILGESKKQVVQTATIES